MRSNQWINKIDFREEENNLQELEKIKWEDVIDFESGTIRKNDFLNNDTLVSMIKEKLRMSRIDRKSVV